MPDQDEIFVTLKVDGSKTYEVRSFELRETLSEVPTYQVTILDQTSELKALLGKPATIEMVQEVYSDAKPRDFAGLIMAIERQVDQNGSDVLELEIRPPLAILGLSTGNAIYENKTALDILKAVLERNGLKKLQVKGSKPTAKRPVVLQYNENDLAFCRRILAEEGLTFYFHDGKSADTLMLQDTQKPFPKSPKQIQLTDAEMSDLNRIEAQSLTLRRAMRADKVELLTYDPSAADKVTTSKVMSGDVSTAEKPQRVEYRPVTVPPGKVAGDEVNVAAAAALRQEFGLRGTCEHPAMFLGQEIDIASDAHADIKGTYVIVGLTYQPERGNALSCTFEALPSSHLPAPDRLPKPQIAGVHNAIVIGPSSAKAGHPACDAEGRVCVRFFWDSAGENTVWLRVAEPFAGKGFGAQFIPRVGHEVLVSFLHGDPDAPVITGQIYNEKNKPPFIAKNTTKSGIRTNLDGDPNELEFDDKKGSELVAVRAAKDYNLIVTESVVRDIKKLETTKIGETCSLEIGKNLVTKVKADIETEGKNRTTEISAADKLKAKDITLEASSSLTLKVGGSSIKLTSSGITISATSVKVDGKSSVKVASKGSLTVDGMSTTLKAKTNLKAQGMMVDVKGQVQAKVSAPMSEVSGSGLLTLKGGVCMLN
ncbi:MAG: type VI secretion system tip protein TssI/VgrG [Pseudomonadota bacterium]